MAWRRPKPRSTAAASLLLAAGAVLSACLLMIRAGAALYAPLSACPPGQAHNSSNGCQLCPGGWCGVLEAAELLPVNLKVQQEVWRLLGPASRLAGYRGYNPSLVSHSGEALLVVRASNATFCPAWIKREPERLFNAKTEASHWGRVATDRWR